MDEQQQFKVAQAAANAVREVAGVAGLHIKRPLIPAVRQTDRVPGVDIQVEGGSYFIEVHLVALFQPGLYLPNLGEAVRERIRQSLAEMEILNVSRINVVLEDIVEANAVV